MEPHHLIIQTCYPVPETSTYIHTFHQVGCHCNHYNPIGVTLEETQLLPPQSCVQYSVHNTVFHIHYTVHILLQTWYSCISDTLLIHHTCYPAYSPPLYPWSYVSSVSIMFLYMPSCISTATFLVFLHPLFRFRFLPSLPPALLSTLIVPYIWRCHPHHLMSLSCEYVSDFIIVMHLCCHCPGFTAPILIFRISINFIIIRHFPMSLNPFWTSNVSITPHFFLQQHF